MSHELKALKAAAVNYADNFEPGVIGNAARRLLDAARAYAESLKPKNTCAGCRSFCVAQKTCALGSDVRDVAWDDPACDHFAPKVEAGT